LNFIKSKFITEEQLSKLAKWKKVGTVLETLVNKAEFTLNRMTSLYNQQLSESTLSKDALNDLVSKFDIFSKKIDDVTELRGEYLTASKSNYLTELGSVDKFLEVNKQRLSFVNKESILKTIESLDKQDFEYVTKLKNFEKNEKNTNDFISFTQEYKSLLKKKS
jgi:hypothetical protein